ncbi:hypothetical protein GCM10023334_014670 [Nonomuraea thailandensis]
MGSPVFFSVMLAVKPPWFWPLVHWLAAYVTSHATAAWAGAAVIAEVTPATRTRVVATARRFDKRVKRMGGLYFTRSPWE